MTFKVVSSIFINFCQNLSLDLIFQPPLLQTKPLDPAKTQERKKLCQIGGVRWCTPGGGNAPSYPAACSKAVRPLWLQSRPIFSRPHWTRNFTYGLLHAPPQKQFFLFISFLFLQISYLFVN